MQTYTKRFLICLAVGFLAWTTVETCQAQLAFSKNTKPRAVPKFSKEVNDIFFADAFSKRGEDDLSTVDPSAPAGNKPKPKSGGGGSSAWSKIIIAGEIENELKSSSQAFKATMRNNGTYTRGIGPIRMQSAMCALMFAMIAEYDADIRFKDVASGMRDKFMKAVQLSESPTPEGFEATKEAVTLLEELILGNKPEIAAGADSADWAGLADINEIMKRAELGYANMKPMISTKADIEDNFEDVLHEANMFAALGEIMKRNEDYGEEDDFKGWANDMRDGGVIIFQALQNPMIDADRVQQGAGAINQSCTVCHGTYR